MVDNSITETQTQQEASSSSWTDGMISLMREIAREEAQKVLSEMVTNKREVNNG